VEDTASEDYTNRLAKIEQNRLKTWLGPLNPYRWNIRRLCSGVVLDVGCGIGRNLRYLDRPDAVGVDHNKSSVAHTKSLGYNAYETSEYKSLEGKLKKSFDSLLISHVLEHLSYEGATQLVSGYLPAIKDGGKIVIICPQQRGYASDSTHVTYFDRSLLNQIAAQVNGTNIQYKSFPFPPWMGKFFIYNEHVLVFKKSTELHE
jgi:2-polyprenyl-3-methyl-5-hydroxy-6-metoxy-1,4-benzoquinol methylase